MKNTDEKRPPLKELKQSRASWLTWLKGEWIKHIPYNRKDKADIKPSKGVSVRNDQFKQLMNQMSAMKTELKSDIDSLRIDMISMETRINTRIDGIDTKLDKLTTIVKKNHPSDFI